VTATATRPEAGVQSFPVRWTRRKDSSVKKVRLKTNLRTTYERVGKERKRKRKRSFVTVGRQEVEGVSWKPSRPSRLDLTLPMNLKNYLRNQFKHKIHAEKN
jgi:hypothetical protein